IRAMRDYAGVNHRRRVYAVPDRTIERGNDASSSTRQTQSSTILSAIGALMGVITFAVTWSFFFTTPGVVKWSLSTDPMAWNLA
ncbi:hypothetical protein FNJ47_47725, partial [Bradyrhizobium sp. UFLA 03-164]|nr:hypothetical protein [Bradyrhizobium uaiense]